jgi:hypothetical protein
VSRWFQSQLLQLALQAGIYWRGISTDRTETPKADSRRKTDSSGTIILDAAL